MSVPPPAGAITFTPKAEHTERLQQFCADLQRTDDAPTQLQCVLGLRGFLDEFLRDGVAPAAVLGQQLCSNALYIVIHKFVEPLLLGSRRGGKGFKGRSTAETLRENIARPLRGVVEGMHHLLPASYAACPLLWKEAAALRAVLSHLSAVLHSESLVPQVGQEYAALLAYLMSFEVYQDALTVGEVRGLSDRLLRLLKTPMQRQSELGEWAAYAAALAGILCAPQGPPLLGDDLPEVMQALCDAIRLHHVEGLATDADGNANASVRAMHQSLLAAASGDTAALVHQPAAAPVGSDLRLQAHLVRCARALVQRSQYDFADSVAAQGTPLIRTLLGIWHRTARRDAWRLEVVQFVAVQLCFCFADELAVACRADDLLLLDRLRAARTAATGGDASVLESGGPATNGTESPAAAAAASLSLLERRRLLLTVVAPIVEAIIAAPRCPFGFVGNRELVHLPCQAMAPVFSIGAIVSCLCTAVQATEDGPLSAVDAPPSRKKLRTHRDTDSLRHEVDTEDGGRFGEVFGPAKLVSIVERHATNTARSDAAPTALHVLAIATATAGLRCPSECTRLAHRLMALLSDSSVSSTLQPLLFAALTPLMGRCHREDLLGWWIEWLPRIVPMRGTVADGGLAPSEQGYRCLAAMLHALRAQRVFHLPVPPGYRIEGSPHVTGDAPPPHFVVSFLMEAANVSAFEFSTDFSSGHDTTGILKRAYDRDGCGGGIGGGSDESDDDNDNSVDNGGGDASAPRTKASKKRSGAKSTSKRARGEATGMVQPSAASDGPKRLATAFRPTAPCVAPPDVVATLLLKWAMYASSVSSGGGASMLGGGAAWGDADAAVLPGGPRTIGSQGSALPFSAVLSDRLGPDAAAVLRAGGDFPRWVRARARLRAVGVSATGTVLQAQYEDALVLYSSAALLFLPPTAAAHLGGGVGGRGAAAGATSAASTDAPPPPPPLWSSIFGPTSAGRVPQAVVDAIAVHRLFNPPLDFSALNAEVFRADPTRQGLSEGMLAAVSSAAVRGFVQLSDRIPSSDLTSATVELRVGVSTLVASAALGLTMLLSWMRGGVWHPSTDEGDAAVLAAGLPAGEAERKLAFARLTPNGNVTLCTVLLLRLVVAHLRRLPTTLDVELRNRNAQTTEETVMRTVLVPLDVALTATHALAEHAGDMLVSFDLCDWDPQQLYRAALLGLVQWSWGTAVALAQQSLLPAVRAALAVVFGCRGSGGVSQRGGPVQGSLAGAGADALGLASAAALGEREGVSMHHLALLTRVVVRAAATAHQLLSSPCRQPLAASAVLPRALETHQLAEGLHVTKDCQGLLQLAGLVGPTACSVVQPLPPLVALHALREVLLVLCAVDVVKAADTIHDVAYTIRTRFQDSFLHWVPTLVASLCGEEGPVGGRAAAMPPLTSVQWAAEMLESLVAHTDGRNADGGASAAVTIALRSGPVDGGEAVQVQVPGSLRKSFELTDALRIGLALAQAAVLRACQGKPWGVRVGRRLFSTTSDAFSFAVRAEASHSASTAFAVYSKGSHLLSELLNHVRGVVLERERSKCATALLALSCATLKAPAIEGDVVSFLLEVHATKEFRHQSMLVEALASMYHHVHDETEGPSTSHHSHRIVTGTVSTNGFAAAAAARVCSDHAALIAFQWVWQLGHVLDAFPAACFGCSTSVELILNNVHIFVPVAVLTAHKVTSVERRSAQQTAGEAYFLGTASSIREEERGDSRALNKIEEISRADADRHTLLQRHLPHILSLLLGLAALPQTAPNAADFRTSSQRALEWLRVQLGQALFRERCHRHSVAIIQSILARCQPTAAASGPAPPFFSLETTTAALKALCELVDLPNFTALFAAHKGERAVGALTFLYTALEAASAERRRACMGTIEGLLTGIFGTAVLALPAVCEAALRLLCYVVRLYPALRPVACSTLSAVWRILSVAAQKHGEKHATPHPSPATSPALGGGGGGAGAAGSTAGPHALLAQHYHLVTSTLSAYVGTCPEAARCFAQISNGSKGGSSSADTNNRLANRLALAMSQPGLEAEAAPADEEQAPIPNANNPPTAATPLVTLHDALRAVAEVPAVLSHFGLVPPPPRYFSSLAEAVDAHRTALARALQEDAICGLQSMRLVGGSDASTRQFQILAVERLWRRARGAATTAVLEGGGGGNHPSSSSDLMPTTSTALGSVETRTATDVLMDAVCYLGRIALRQEVPLDGRGAALDALRALSMCFIEGGVGDVLRTADLHPTPWEDSAALAAAATTPATSAGVAASSTATASTMRSALATDFSTRPLEENVAAVYARLLLDMRTLTLDASPPVMDAARSALRGVMAAAPPTTHSVIAAAFVQLPPQDRERLEAFLPERLAAAGAAAIVRGDAHATTLHRGASQLAASTDRLLAEAQASDADALWQAAVSDPSLFVRQLTAALIQQHLAAPFPFLVPMARLAVVHARFAAALLPLVLLHLTYLSRRDSPRDVLAVRIHALLRRAAAAPQAATCVLQALSFLQAARAGATAHFGQTIPDDVTVAKEDANPRTEQRRRVQAASEGSTMGPVELLKSPQDALWFPCDKLPFLVLARAAADCGAWDACVQWVHWHFEGSGDYKGIGPAAAASTLAETLLGPRSTAWDGSGSAPAGAQRRAARHREEAVRLRHAQAHDILLRCATVTGDVHLLEQVSSVAERGAVMEGKLHITATAKLAAERFAAVGNWAGGLQHANAWGQAADRTSVGWLLDAGCPEAAFAVARQEMDRRLAEAAWRSGVWDPLDGPNAAERSASLSRGHHRLAANPTAASTSSVMLDPVHECIHKALRGLSVRDAASARAAVAEGLEALVAVVGPFTATKSVVLAEAMRLIGSVARSHRDEASAWLVQRPQWIHLPDDKADVHAARVQLTRREDIGRCGSDYFSVVEPLAAVQQALCAMAAPPAWHAAFLTEAATDAASSAAPWGALRWVQKFMQQYANEPSSSAGPASAPVTAGPHHVVDSALVLSCARLTAAAGNMTAAMQLLWRDPNRSAEAVVQLAAWAAAEQRIPLSALLREASLTTAIVQDAPLHSHHLFAELCDALLQSARTRLTNFEHRQHVEELARSAKLCDERLAATKDKGERSRLSAKIREIEAAQGRAAELSSNWHFYRINALNAYALAAKTDGSARDRHIVFRLLSIWVGADAVPPEGSSGGEKQLEAAVLENITAIPPSRLLAIYPQLCVRLGGCSEIAEDAASTQALRTLCEGVAAALPQQCLWQLIAISGGGAGKNTAASPSASTSATPTTRTAPPGPTTRQALAEDILERFSNSSNGPLATLTKEMRTLAAVYTAISLLKPPKTAKKADLPPEAAQWATRCRAVAVPTLPMRAVSAFGTASSVTDAECVMDILPSLDILGGLSRPICLSCLTTRGNIVRQIVKAEDMRQDAVLMQAFSLANALLLAPRVGYTGLFSRGGQQQGQQGQSSLLQASHVLPHMRTFVALPIGPQCGIMQMVEGARALMEVLAAPDGLHPRYFPAEPVHYQTREWLAGAQKERRAAAVFVDICEAVTPALHYFFFEKFASAKQWAESRRRYAVTAAVSSIVGFAVGLGDRHVGNIMLDERTGDVVHIDLGIALDQGEILTVPERVPFRLTRDVVDGLGVHGVDGVFKAVCEDTLGVLRANRQLVLTALEQLVHDPLVQWARGAEASLALADNDPTSGNGAQEARRATRRAKPAEASRALQRASDKLNGVLGGEELSVHRQARSLIATAASNDLLAEMFVGWSPWL